MHFVAVRKIFTYSQFVGKEIMKKVYYLSYLKKYYQLNVNLFNLLALLKQS